MDGSTELSIKQKMVEVMDGHMISLSMHTQVAQKRWIDLENTSKTSIFNVG